MESYRRKQWNKKHSINIRVLSRKESHVISLIFCNADIINIINADGRIFF